MVRVFSKEMVDIQAGFNGDQSTFPEHGRCFPREFLLAKVLISAQHVATIPISNIQSGFSTPQRSTMIASRFRSA